MSKRFIHVSAFLLVSTLSFSQDVEEQKVEATRVLTITETDENGEKYASQTEVFTQIVDINSHISIAIDKLELQKVIVQSSEETAIPNDLIARLKVLQNLTDQSASSLEKLRTELRNWKSQESGDIVALRTALSPVAQGVLAIAAVAPRGSELRSNLNNALVNLPIRSSIVDQYSVVYEMASLEVDRINTMLDGQTRKSGYYVQLGAWMVTKASTTPIHLQGFDTYPEGEPFEVDRWNITLSEDQKSELENLSQLAQKLKDDKLAPILKDFGNTASGMIENIIDEAQSCLTDFEFVINRMKDNLQQTEDAIRDEVEAMENAKNDYEVFLKSIRDRYVTSTLNFESDTELLVSSNQDLTELRSQTANLINALKVSAGKIIDLGGAVSNQFQASFQELESITTSCEDRLKEEMFSAINSVKGLLQNLSGVTKINDELLEFGEKVKKLSFESVPEKTDFQLVNTGRRTPGDAVVIRLQIARNGDDTDQVTVETQTLRVFQVMGHLETKVGLIFAAPVVDTEISSTFQFAPSYSLLYKSGSRGKVARNTFFDLGLGLNVSALDFNVDETPELGIGFVISYFNDYTQAGIGHNISDNSPFYFFGLRLPLSVEGLARSD